MPHTCKKTPKRVLALPRPNCGSLHRRDRRRFAVERGELNFEGLSVRVHVHHRTDVPRFEALSGYGRGQNDSIVLLDHCEGSLLARIRGDEPRNMILPWRGACTP